MRSLQAYTAILLIFTMSIFAVPAFFLHTCTPHTTAQEAPHDHDDVPHEHEEPHHADEYFSHQGCPACDLAAPAVLETTWEPQQPLPIYITYDQQTPPRLLDAPQADHLPARAPPVPRA